MSCCKIMMHPIFSKVSNQTSCVDIMTRNVAMTGKWVIRVRVQRGISFTMKRLGRNLFYQFRRQRFLKMKSYAPTWRQGTSEVKLSKNGG